jgi:hypothetical protein
MKDFGQPNPLIARVGLFWVFDPTLLLLMIINILNFTLFGIFIAMEG